MLKFYLSSAWIGVESPQRSQTGMRGASTGLLSPAATNAVAMVTTNLSVNGRGNERLCEMHKWL